VVNLRIFVDNEKIQKTMINSVVTRKPSVRAHIPSEQEEIVKAYMSSNDLTQSEAVRDALDVFYGLDEADRQLLKKIAIKCKRSIGSQGAILLSEAIRANRASAETNENH
jgi:hypothetical protein